MAEDIRMSMKKQRQAIVRINHRDFPSEMKIEGTYNGEPYSYEPDKDVQVCEGIVKLLRDACYMMPDPKQKIVDEQNPQKWIKERRYNIEVIEWLPMPHEKKRAAAEAIDGEVAEATV